MSEKHWYGVDLSKERAAEFEEYLKANEIDYEPSQNYSLIHFQCLLSLQELEVTNKWLFNFKGGKNND